MSKVDKVKVADLKKSLQETIVALDLVLDDKLKLVDIAKSLDITPYDLSREITSKFKYYIGRRMTTEDMTKLALSMELPSDKIIKRAFNVNTTDAVILPEYNPNTFLILLQEYLTKRQYDIVHRRYYRNMSRKEISEEFDVNIDDIRQLEIKGISRVRSNSFINALFGLNYVNLSNTINAQIKDKIDFYNSSCEKLETLKTAIDSIGYTTGLMAYIDKFYPNVSAFMSSNKTTLPTTNYFVNCTENTPITDLNFSVRLENGLHKIGIFTIGDICNASASDIISIKYIGKACINNLIDIMNKYAENNPKWIKLKADLLEAYLKEF